MSTVSDEQDVLNKLHLKSITIMPTCAILNCENDSKTNNAAQGGVSYHRFPKKLSMKKEWIKATGRENWKPAKSSAICSDHFDKKEIQISEKGYKYLNDDAIPIQKIIIVQDQNEKQKDAVENEAGPAQKLHQNKKMKKEEIPAVKLGPSEKLANIEEVKEEAAALEPGPSKKSAMDEVEKVEGAAAVKPGPSKKRHQKEEVAPEAQPGPSRKRHQREGEQEEGPAAKKARKDKDPEPNQNPPKLSSKEKLFKLLRWNHDKIRKQHLKIKSLQTANRNLTQNVRIIEELVKQIYERITMTNEDLFNLKMTLT